MMAKKSSSRRTKETKPTEAFDFEASLSEVEQIVTKLESGELGLTESLESYESGIKQLKRCHSMLDAAEQRVSMLSGFDADGNPVTQPIGESDGGNENVRPDGGKKKVSKSKRQSTSSAKGGKGHDDALSQGDDNADSVDDLPGLF